MSSNLDIWAKLNLQQTVLGGTPDASGLTMAGKISKLHLPGVGKVLTCWCARPASASGKMTALEPG